MPVCLLKILVFTHLPDVSVLRVSIHGGWSFHARSPHCSALPGEAYSLRPCAPGMLSQQLQPFGMQIPRGFFVSAANHHQPHEKILEPNKAKRRETTP